MSLAVHCTSLHLILPFNTDGFYTLALLSALYTCFSVGVTRLLSCQGYIGCSLVHSTFLDSDLCHGTCLTFTLLIQCMSHAHPCKLPLLSNFATAVCAHTHKPFLLAHIWLCLGHAFTVQATELQNVPADRACSTLDSSAGQNGPQWTGGNHVSLISQPDAFQQNPPAFAGANFGFGQQNMTPPGGYVFGKS